MSDKNKDTILAISRQLGIQSAGDGLLAKIRQTIDLLQEAAAERDQLKARVAEEKLAQRNAKTAPNEGVWTPRFKIKGSRKWVLCSEQASNYEYIAKHVRKMQEMQKTVNWQAVRDDGLIYDPKVAKLNAEVNA